MANAFLMSDLHVDHYLGSKPSKTGLSNLLSRHLCPADVLLLAGDTSNHVEATRRTLSYFSELYAKVLWVPGNHDLVAHNGENSFDKVARLARGIKEPNVTLLAGAPFDLHGRTVGGSMGYCDFSYAEKHFGQGKEAMAAKWKASWFDGRFWNIGDKGPLDVWADEYARLDCCVTAGADLMVSHFGPYDGMVPPRFHNPLTGYFYFDGAGLLERMPAGSHWCYGHTHDKAKYTVGGVTMLCNPFGYPDEQRDGDIPKEEFVFEI